MKRVILFIGSIIGSINDFYGYSNKLLGSVGCGCKQHDFGSIVVWTVVRKNVDAFDGAFG